MRILSPLLLVELAALTVSGCGSAPSYPFKNTPIDQAGRSTLYDRLGGGPALYAVAESLTERTLADPRVNLARLGQPHQWSATPDHVAELKMYWAQYLGMIADGPPVYEGKNLLDVHRGMRISEAEWYAFMDDLRIVLAASHIQQADQTELLNRVAASHDVVVNQ